MAQEHAGNLPVGYQCLTIGSCGKATEGFDVVCLMEVVEHVESVTSVLADCVPYQAGGILVVSTINRTVASPKTHCAGRICFWLCSPRYSFLV